MDIANACLPPFLEHFNLRFGVPPAEPGSAYRVRSSELDLERVCCFK